MTPRRLGPAHVQPPGFGTTTAHGKGRSQRPRTNPARFATAGERPLAVTRGVKW